MLLALQCTLPLQALCRFLAVCGTCAERFENAGLLYLLFPALEQAVIALVTFSVGVNGHSRGQSMVGAHRLQGYFARKNWRVAHHNAFGTMQPGCMIGAMIDLSHACTVAMEAAQSAGQRIQQGYGEELHIQVKSAPVDRVTHIDTEAQAAIIDIIRAAYPDHAILGEEGEQERRSSSQSAYRWVIDPLDGTSNFIQRLPHVGVSIALQHREQTVFGLLFFPVLQQMYTATHGGGAFCNSVPIQIHDCTDMAQAFIAEIFSDRDASGRQVTYPPGLAFRKYGSAITSCAYLAAGHVHAVALHCHLWDIAAAELLIREAGGRVEWSCDVPGDERGALTFFAAVPGIFAEFREMAAAQYAALSGGGEEAKA